MKPNEADELFALLKRIESTQYTTLFRAVSMMIACCQEDSELGSVVLVRSPMDDENWVLHIHALNLDLDDTYIALSKAAQQVAEHIQAEAPSAYLN